MVVVRARAHTIELSVRRNLIELAQVRNAHASSVGQLDLRMLKMSATNQKREQILVINSNLLSRWNSNKFRYNQSSVSLAIG